MRWAEAKIVFIVRQASVAIAAGSSYGIAAT
jgi:hypothetical protein